MNEDFKVNFTYAYQQTKTDGGQYNSDGVLGTGRYQSAGRFDEPAKRRAHLVSVEVNANIADIADLVATTAYTDVKNNTSFDITDLLLDLDYGYESFPAFSAFNENTNTPQAVQPGSPLRLAPWRTVQLGGRRVLQPAEAGLVRSGTAAQPPVRGVRHPAQPR